MAVEGMTEYQKFILESFRTMTFAVVGFMVTWMIVADWKSSMEHHSAVRQERLRLRGAVIDKFVLNSHKYTAVMHGVTSPGTTQELHEQYSDDAFDGYSTEFHRLAVYFGINAMDDKYRWESRPGKSTQKDVDDYLKGVRKSSIRYAWMKAYAMNDIWHGQYSDRTELIGLEAIQRRLKGIEKEVDVRKELKAIVSEPDARVPEQASDSDSTKAPVDRTTPVNSDQWPYDAESHQVRAAKRLIKFQKIAESPDIKVRLESMIAEKRASRSVDGKEFHFNQERINLRSAHHELIQRCINALKLDGPEDSDAEATVPGRYILATIVLAAMAGFWCIGLKSMRLA